MLSSRLLLSVLICTSALAVADAAPAPSLGARKLDPAKPLPAGVKAKGTQVREAWTWTNPDGAPGYLVLSVTSNTRTVSRQLYAQVYGGKQPREIRLVKDGLSNCKLDLVANFLAGSVSIDDIDGDGTPEIAFAYDVVCSATADPVPRKLIILEGGAKYALRGRGMGKDPDDKVIGGDYKADAFKGAEAIGTWAEARWKELLAHEPTVFE